MTKTTIAAIALMVALNPSLALAGGIDITQVFNPAPRAEGPSAGPSTSIGDAFHQTDNDNGFDDIFHPQQPDKPTIYKDIGLGMGAPDIGLANKPTGGIGKIPVGALRGGDVASVKGDLGGISLKCDVAGTPSEFPDDLRIRNAGLTTLPAGMQIQWKAAGEIGLAVFGKALKPGQSAKLSNVLDRAAEAGTTCSAKAIGL